MKGCRHPVPAGISLLLLLIGACHMEKSVPIVMDGQMGDWSGIPAIVTDQPQQTPGFTAIYMSHDDDSVFIRLDLNAVINYQSLIESTLTFYFDADGNPDTGSRSSPLPGAEIAVELSPLARQWPGRPRQGARVLLFSDHSDEPIIESSYGVGLMGAPAHSARAFEFRLARAPRGDSGPALFAGDHLRGKLVHGTGPEQVLQQSPEFEYQLSGTNPTVAMSERQIETQLRPNDADSIRVVGWNIADHFFHDRFDAFARILGAIDADVLLLDEAPEDISEETVRRLITAMGASAEAKDWHIQIGQGGGRQRGVIASHLPISHLSAFDPLSYSDEVVEFVHKNGTRSMVLDLRDMRQEGMPILAVGLDWMGREVLLATMDFQCCGFDGSPEDHFRNLQANTVRHALNRQIAQSGAPDALILAGDINLVGSRSPLERLYSAADLDGSDLANASPSQFDQRSTATFGFRGSFPPGQLDYLLFSDSSLELLRAFVFDSRDLPETLATKLGVNLQDSTQSSDHMPVVADFTFR